MAILNPALSHLLWEKDYFDKDPSLGTHPVPDDREIPIKLIFTGDFATIEALGFKGTQAIGGTAFGKADLPTLRALAQHPQVKRIDPRGERSIGLNDSIPDIEADQVWSRSASTFTGYTGKGVVIGIIDTGIDITHPVFKNPDGTTRIISIWDQTIITPIKPPVSGEKPPGTINNPLLSPSPVNLNYGVEYTTPQIQQSLANPSTPVCRSVDDVGHGTHVAGIAGGNGSAGGDCFGPYRYIGVAPEASFVIVRMWGLSPGDRGENLDPPQKVSTPSAGDAMIDALQYVVNKAKPNGGTQMALAINLSLQAFDSTLMDGSDADSHMIDTLLSQSGIKGIGVSVIAGNYARRGWHIVGTVPANGTLDLALNMGPNEKPKRQISIYFTGSTVQATMDSPYPTNVTVNPGAPNTTANGSGSSVSITPGASGIVIGFTPPSGGLNVSGTWTIHLKNTGAAAVAIEGYCDGVNQGDNFFFTDESKWSPGSTLSDLACGQQSIASGSYLVSNHTLSDFSSHGPTLTGGPSGKPELCAPGQDIKSAGGSIHCKCCCKCCQHWYVSDSGTSMASPHVAGTMALMLHKNPNLTVANLRANLTAAADTNPPPSGTSGADLTGWGAGRLDAKKAVGAVTPFNAPVEAPAIVRAPEQALSLQDELLRTPNGKNLAGIFERFFPEIMDLINHNRRVATIWHRVKGPVWTRLATQAFFNPRLKLQPEIEGLSLADAALRFLGILNEYASATLLGELKPFEPLLAGFNREMSLEEMIQMVGNYKQEATVWPPQPVH